MQPLGKPIAKFILRLGITANQITIMSFFIALGSAYFMAQGELFVGIIIWWVSRIFDGLDGVIARQSNTSSAFGGFLDISLDMLAYCSIVVGFSFSFPNLNHLWMLILVGYVGCITTALAFGQMNEDAVDKSDNRSLQLAMGLAEATETGIAYTLFAFFPNYLEELAVLWITILAITILARFTYAYLLHKRL